MNEIAVVKAYRICSSCAAILEHRRGVLKGEIKTHRHELEICEQQLNLLEQYKSAQLRMIEAGMSEKFGQHIKIRLAETLLNGDVIDCCEILDQHGVPFCAGLNHGAQVNLGIEIINDLGFQMPIFVDNAESINKLEKTDNQVIRLIVSNDEKLKIEVENE